MGRADRQDHNPRDQEHAVFRSESYGKCSQRTFDTSRNCNAVVENDPAVAALKADLLAVNLTLWDIEDHIRDKELQQAFDAEFIELARSVYFQNDRRAMLKKQMNMALKSELVEEKSYKKYS